MPKATPEEKINRIKYLASSGLSQRTVQKYDPRKPGRGSRKHLRKSYA